jgi:transcription elongation GreA/GreB family factor
MPVNAPDLAELVKAKIENLRPKLLDLSRRNPLIATKLGPRSNSHIRVVDELPDILFFRLNNAQEMNLVALPPIDEDPRDELSSAFRNALINARLTDEAYLASMEAVDRDADDYLDKTRRIERELKDRVRELLGLVPRTNKTEVNLSQHARNNGISPSYELPNPNQAQEDRHTDNNIQTLLLPSDLERKLNAILSKCRTWLQETGINVLQVAFGFLEWSDDSEKENAFAPLVLLEAEITKQRTSQGIKFSIRSIGNDPQLNAVLAEKLRIDFGIVLPPFEGTSVENYLASIAELTPKKSWRVRRQVAIGVFPSARMAMYSDLDPKSPKFPRSEIVQSLLAGSDASGAAPFADEYDIDNPDIERKVPCLVLDADSSQFSALADIGDGKNVAIEGPPGTGKSQTIVNAIAAALSAGKKVLFVAEKLAALNVVKSRLEAIGLGEFLLPLQADKSTREQVMNSVRARLSVRDITAVRGYDEKLDEFRHTREQLAAYIALITSTFEDSGFTVHAILGKSIATAPLLDGIPRDALENCKLRSEVRTAGGLSTLLRLAAHLAEAHNQASAAELNWKGTRLLHPERFAVEEACEAARLASEKLREAIRARETLTAFGLPLDMPADRIEEIGRLLVGASNHTKEFSSAIITALLDGKNATAVRSFLDACERARETSKKLAGLFAESLDEGTLSKADEVDRACRAYNVQTINLSRLTASLDESKAGIKRYKAYVAALEPLMTAIPEARKWPLDGIIAAHALYRTMDRDALTLRAANLAEPKNLYLLRKLCDEGTKLRRMRDELEKRVVLAIDVPVATLIQSATTLRTAGLFSMFASGYRKAKRLSRSICRAKKLSTTEMVSRLDDLIGFRKGESAILTQIVESGLFGPHERGLDTDFASFQRVAEFYSRLDETIDGPQYAAIRVFLRDAPVSSLSLLISLPENVGNTTVEALEEAIAVLVVNVERLGRAVDALTSCSKVFANRDLTPQAIREACSSLKILLADQTRLDADVVVQRLLGAHFSGHRTRSHQLLAVVDWANSAAPYRGLLEQIIEASEIEVAHAACEAAVVADGLYDKAFLRLSETAKVDAEDIAGELSPLQLADKFEAASRDPQGLFAHAHYATALNDMGPHGVMPLIEDSITRRGTLLALSEVCEALAMRQLAKAVFDQHKAKLAKLRGAKLDELRATLAEKDREIIKLARRQLRAKVYATARPAPGNGIGRKSTWTDMALIENELSKKQRFIPVRDLTQRAGNALLELKPCWMMSPLAVAQYIPKGTLNFDLCIIDEASQMPPESAVGALLRCKQAVVVGDTNQLPPSNFFKTLVDDEEASEDETVLNESILEMANATFRPARQLRWHYRSRHSGLIKFSNRLVYKDNLVVFPSATEAMSRMGVELRHVQGRYKAGTNPVEAKAIVDAIFEFMKDDAGRSLGVVTLNQKQRDLISEEFEYAIASNRAAQKYIDAWKEKRDGLEEFFIKNLENVQGDERDVIFIGTVYGAEQPGARVMQRFGPINGIAGMRRLNVLFTRAREKIVTFSSMTAADIEAEEHTNPGTYMLKRWLEYSASGVLDSGEETEREPDSDFELFVIDQIRAMGCIPVPQVGVAGYFVDIGVRHPDWPYGFVLGVECDGATYHSAKSARDRDRLRQEILEGLGWKLHRIWSTDWFNNPRQEAERLRSVIATRLSALKEREHEFGQPLTTSDVGKSAAQDNRPPDTKDLFADEGRPGTVAARSITAESGDNRVEVGDTVRVRYLSDDKRVVHITISDTESDPSRGIVYRATPIAAALLGAEKGEEVEVLVGSYIRPAVIEDISKNRAKQRASSLG